MSLRLRAALLLLALLTAAGWVLGTASGMRATLALAERWGGLRVAEAHGRWWGPLEVTGLHYASPTTDLFIERLQMDWAPGRLLLGRLRIRSLAVDGLRVERRKGEESGVREPFTLNVPLPIQIEALELHDAALITAQGRTIVLPEATLRGYWQGPWMEIEHLRIAHPLTGPLEARGGLVMAFGELRFRQMEITGPGHLLLDGQVALHPEGRNRLQVSGENLRWPLTGEPVLRIAAANARTHGQGKSFDWTAQLRLPTGAVLDGLGHWTGENVRGDIRWTNLSYPLLKEPVRLRSAEGKLRIEGRPERYTWKLQAGLAAEPHEAQLEAAGRGNRKEVHIEQARLQGFDGSLQGAGRIGWRPAFNADLQLRLASLNPAALWPEWPGAISGDLELIRRAGGPEPEPATAFRLQVEDSVLRGYPLALKAEGVYQRGAVRLQNGQGRVGTTRVTLSGRLSPPYQVQGRIESKDLRTLLPELSGQLRANFRFEGTRLQPQLELKGDARNLRYRAWHAGQLDADVRLHPRGPSHLRLIGQDLFLPRRVQRLEINAGGRLREHRIELAAELPEARATLVAHGALNLQRPAWQGRVETLQLIPEVTRPWEQYGESPLRIVPGELELEPLCVRQGDSFACLGLEYGPQRTRLRTRLQSFDLHLLAPLMPADWRVEGTVSGRLDLRLANGMLRELQGELLTSAGAIRAGTRTQLRFRPSRIALQPESGGQLRATADLQLEHGRATADLRFSPGPDLLTRPVQGRVRLDLPDLAFLKLATPEIASARGQLTGEAAVGGTVRELRLQGGLQVRDGELQLTTPGIRLTDLAVDLTTASGQRMGIRARARSGGGDLSLEGSISNFGPPLRAHFELRGQDFQMADTPAARIWVTPELQLAIDGRSLDLRGVMDVPRALLTPRQLELGVSPSQDQILVGSAESEEDAEGQIRTRSQVLLRLGKDVRFEGYGLRTGLSGRLLTTDVPARPTVGRGELRLEGGRYKAYGQELEIESGRLIFAGGPVRSPGVDLRAVRKPREDVKVGVMVRGTLDDPTFSLFSEPPMPRDQQLSWLVLGQPLNEAPTGTQGEQLAGAAMALGLKGGDFIAQRLGKELGLDQISIGSKPGETADQARLIVGKYLSPRLFVSYGFGLFQPGRYFRLLYDLKHGFKLSAEGGVNTGADLLYTIER